MTVGSRNLLKDFQRFCSQGIDRFSVCGHSGRGSDSGGQVPSCIFRFFFSFRKRSEERCEKRTSLDLIRLQPRCQSRQVKIASYQCHHNSPCHLLCNLINWLKCDLILSHISIWRAIGKITRPSSNWQVRVMWGRRTWRIRWGEVIKCVVLTSP